MSEGLMTRIADLPIDADSSSETPIFAMAVADTRQRVRDARPSPTPRVASRSMSARVELKNPTPDDIEQAVRQLVGFCAGAGVLVIEATTNPGPS